MFIERRFQYQQLIPRQASTVPFNEITYRNGRPPQDTHTTAQAKGCANFIENCQYCGKKLHKDVICRSKKHDQANNEPQENRQMQPLKKHPKYNSELVRSLYGFTSHSVRDSRHRAEGALVSEVYHMTKKSLTQTRISAKGPSHDKKEPQSTQSPNNLGFPIYRRAKKMSLSTDRATLFTAKLRKVHIMFHHNLAFVLETQKKNKKRMQKTTVSPIDANNLLGTPVLPQKIILTRTL